MLRPGHRVRCAHDLNARDCESACAMTAWVMTGGWAARPWSPGRAGVSTGVPGARISTVEVLRGGSTRRCGTQLGCARVPPPAERRGGCVPACRRAAPEVLAGSGPRGPAGPGRERERRRAGAARGRRARRREPVRPRGGPRPSAEHGVPRARAAPRGAAGRAADPGGRPPPCGAVPDGARAGGRGAVRAGPVRLLRRGSTAGQGGHAPARARPRERPPRPGGRSAGGGRPDGCRRGSVRPRRRPRDEPRRRERAGRPLRAHGRWRRAGPDRPSSPTSSH